MTNVIHTALGPYCCRPMAHRFSIYCRHVYLHRFALPHRMRRDISQRQISKLLNFPRRYIRFCREIFRASGARFNLDDNERAALFANEIQLSLTPVRPPVGFYKPIPFRAQKRRGDLFAAAANELFLGLGHGNRWWGSAAGAPEATSAAGGHGGRRSRVSRPQSAWLGLERNGYQAAALARRALGSLMPQLLFHGRGSATSLERHAAAPPARVRGQLLGSERAAPAELVPSRCEGREAECAAPEHSLIASRWTSERSLRERRRPVLPE